MLIDIPTQTRYVPEFNSLIAFRIPRFHEFTAVTADRARYRYASIDLVGLFCLYSRSLLPL